MVPDALNDILSWSKDRPIWQRHALHKICVNNDLTSEDIVSLTDICKLQTTALALLTKNDIQAENIVGNVTLKSIHNVANVNALAKNQKLQFYPTGLTIVYGDNGAGKSGYTRILKQICRARNLKRESILANIYEDNPGLSKATITYLINNKVCEIEWTKDQTTDAALSSISVFDSSTANVHVEATNDVAYVPFPMELLRKLVSACLLVKEKLQNEIDILKGQTPNTLKTPQCSPKTPVGIIINNLKGNTSADEISNLTILSDADKKRREQLAIDLSGDPNKAVRELQAKVNKLQELICLKNNLEKIISDDYIYELKTLKNHYATCNKAANTAASELFKNDPLPDIGNNLWKILWESAKNFSEKVAYTDKPFPATINAKCVLCQQEIEPEAADRLDRFHEFIATDTKQKEKNALLAYKSHLEIASKQNISIKEIYKLTSYICNELNNKELSETYHDFIIKAKWALRSIVKLKSNIPSKPVLADSIFNQELNGLTQRITDLFKIDNAECRTRLLGEKQALDDRVWLKVVEIDVLAEIQRKKKIEALENLIKQTSTSPITSKISDISEKLVTNALRAQFSKEIALLKISSLAIELKQEKSSYGAAQFKVIMTRKPTVKVGQILSEGEFRCIALAAFLAELATTETQSAIIFDDPVSSLDHSHREAVAKRLASESLKRQVIVFTHNLEFLYLLDEACRHISADINYRHVTKLPDNSQTGICHNDVPPKAQNVHRRIKSIETRLNNEKIHHQKGDDASWEKTIRNLQDDLRFTWERAVEEILAVVLSRFSNKVDTKGLSQLTALTLNDCTTMRDAYGRISSWMHSDGIGLNRNLPTPTDIEQEISILKNWHQDLKDKQAKI